MPVGKKTTIPLNSKQYIFFDLDGTILNSEPLHMEAIRQLLLQQNPVIKISIEKLDHLFHGKDDLAVFNSLKQKYSSFNLVLTDFLKLKNKLYQQLLAKINHEQLETLVTPGLRRFIKRMYQQKKVLGLVSASEQEVVYQTLKRLKIEKFFSIIEYRRPEIASKPSAAPYLSAMQQLGAKPENSIIFEDSPTGLTAALATKASVYQIYHFTPRTIGVATIKNFNSRKLK